MARARQVKKLCPIVNISPDIRYPVLGATYQPRAGIAKHDHVAWGYARRANDARRGPDPELRGHRVRDDGDRSSACRPPAAHPAGQVGLCAAGHSSVLAEMAGLRLPIQSHPCKPWSPNCTSRCTRPS